MFLSLVFLWLIYKRRSPLVSAFCFVLTVCSIFPLLCFIGPTWIVFFIILVFLSGVLVIIVYFTSVAIYCYKKAPIWGLFLTLPFLNCCFLFINVYINLGLSVLSMSTGLFVVLFVLLALIRTLVFASYLLSRGEALVSSR